ncbi:MAG: ribulose-phosphate 3-epimerase, partial [Candidatus Diapherotrites archaeon CG_4_10_14_0_2_um_filter_31_5]
IKSFYKKISLPIDIHLMIEKPEEVIEQYLQFNPSFLSFHVEACSEPKK